MKETKKKRTRGPLGQGLAELIEKSEPEKTGEVIKKMTKKTPTKGGGKTE